METSLWFMCPIYEKIHKNLFATPSGAGPNNATIFCGNKEKNGDDYEHFVCETFCPGTFCLQGILSGGILSARHFVL